MTKVSFEAQQISKAEVVLAFCIDERVVINQRHTIVLSGNVQMNVYKLTKEQNNLIDPEFHSIRKENVLSTTDTPNVASLFWFFWSRKQGVWGQECPRRLSVL